MMCKLPYVVILLVFSLLSTVAPLSAETSAENSDRLKAYRQEHEELKGMQAPDTEFRSNAGLSFTQKLPEWTGFGNGKDIDTNLIEPFEEVQTELFQDRLNRKGDIRKRQLEQIRKKQNNLDALEQANLKSEQKTTERLREISEGRLQKNGKISSKLKAEQNQLRKELVRARSEGQKIREAKTKLQSAKNSTRMKQLNRSMAKDRQKLAMLKKSAARGKAWGNKGAFIVGAIMSGISAELEENALAEQEGRPPSKLNKTINFINNVSGFAAISGAYTNIQIAETEAYLKTLETYEALGYDITDDKVQRWAANEATKAKIRTTVYEGAKLAPIAGDLINIKEGFDAAGEAYVAAEEAAYMVAGNEEAQFQTSLRAAVKIEAKARQMEAIAENVKRLYASLGKLKTQLLAMEQAAEANRDLVKQAVHILEAYNEQAEALQNPAIAANLEAGNVDSLLARLNEVKIAADEQAGNMKRVKDEHQSGQLTAQGVATKAKFIGDLLQPTISDYANLRSALTSIEAISRGNELAAEVPRAIELLSQAKAVMQQQGERSKQLFETYRDQADRLEELNKEFQGLRGEMTKALAYVGTSKNLEDPHQDKIRAALDRANNTDINPTTLRRAIDDAKGLRNSADMVSALAGLDKVPKTVDTAQVDALVQKAQLAWQKLIGPDQAAAESLQNAQNLLNELMALAGDAKPVQVGDEKITVASNSIQKGFFAGKNPLGISPFDIELALKNKTEKHHFDRRDFLGFTAYEPVPGASSDACRKQTDDYCPPREALYRVLEKGTTKRSTYKKSEKVNYWIALRLWSNGVEFLKPYEIVPLNSYKYLTNYQQRKNARVDVRKINARHADEAYAVTVEENDLKDVIVFFRKGPLYLRSEAEIDCHAARFSDDDSMYRYELGERNAFEPTEYVKKEVTGDFIDSCTDGYEKREEILAEHLDNLVVEATPVLDKLRSEFYFSPIKLNLSFKGLQPSETNGKYPLASGRGTGLSYHRNWEKSNGSFNDLFSETYHVTVSMKGDIGYKTSPKEIIEEINKNIDEQASKDLSYNGGKNRSELPVALEGVDYARLVRSANVHKEKGRLTLYKADDYLGARMGNIYIRMYSIVSSDQPGYTRFNEIAQALISEIGQARKGW